MNHKPFENWILDELHLDVSQKKEMEKHLSVCPRCKRLDTGWQASKRLMTHAQVKAPASGFSTRWQAYAVKKQNLQKIRRYRLTLIGLFMLVFAASLTYMVASGSFLQMIADAFNGLTNMIIAITSGLSALGLWLYRMPIAIPLTLGFIFFGLVNAFIMVAAFTLWNLKQRKVQTDEIRIE